MTDKQIICKCNDKECGQCSFEEQLRAKEQECEGLTSKCSQLEEEIKDWQKEVERIQFIGSYGIMDEVKKNTKLEQTLTEIKEIAEEYQKQYIVNNGVFCYVIKSYKKSARLYQMKNNYCDISASCEIVNKLEAEVEQLRKQLENFCFDCDVAERMRKVTYAATGGRLSYANYTVEAIEQAYNDQLRIDVEYRTKELEEQLDQLKAENETQQKALELQKCWIDNLEFQRTKLKQTLSEIKQLSDRIVNSDDLLLWDVYELNEQINQKISEVLDVEND